ncbi:MAG: hypothetical protein MN733_14165 [Nitrososphaera sp.]|nr:hypothetical protein [Nitrososphaera sp.]
MPRDAFKNAPVEVQDAHLGTQVETKGLALPSPMTYTEDTAMMELRQPSDTAPSGFEIIRVAIPRNFETLTPLQTAIIMQSTPIWSEYELPFLLHAQAKCKTLGIDPLSGEVYPVDGRLNTTDRAKIRHARASGKIQWMKVGDPVEAQHPFHKTKDFYVVAEIKHREEDEPQTYKAWYSEWNSVKNANWQQRPIESLQRKALARLSDRMFPLSDDEDFAPISNATGFAADMSKQLGEQLKQLVAQETETKTKPGQLPESL